MQRDCLGNEKSGVGRDRKNGANTGGMLVGGTASALTKKVACQSGNCSRLGGGDWGNTGYSRGVVKRSLTDDPKGGRAGRIFSDAYIAL